MFLARIFSHGNLFAFAAGLFVLSVADGAHAGSFSIVHDFQGTEGANPEGGLVADASGNLYGTTWSGGTYGSGTVFKIAPDGTYTTLYAFCPNQDEACPDGSGPVGALAIDASGDLFGTTSQGGGFQCGIGCGVVFEITNSGAERALYAFQGGFADGYLPQSGITIDPSGNLYGTTEYGGATDVGTVFKVTNSGAEKILWSFGGSPDGVYPVGGLVIDKSGNLYGTTAGEPLTSRQQCGEGFCGTIYEIASGGSYTQLYSFCGRAGCRDGGNPEGDLIVDGDRLFGTTLRGGAKGCSQVGCGTVFALTLGTNRERVLHDFSGRGGGAAPAAGLIFDGAGNLLGTTLRGGGRECSPAGCGTAFALTRSARAAAGAFKVIHDFDGSKGAAPAAPLLFLNGSYYGTAEYGGNCTYYNTGCGIVFRITHSAT